MKKASIFFVVLFLLIGILPRMAAAQGSGDPKMMKEIVKVNYIDARSAYSILMPYMSRIGKLQLVRESNMLVIEDIPEIVDKILTILEEIDVKPLDLQFTVDLIVGSMSSSPATGGGESREPS